MPKLILTDELEEGMEIALPVKNRYGQILLSANIKLDGKHKKILKTWGIQSLYIKDGNDGDKSLKYDENEKIEAKKLLDQRIKWHPRNSYEEDLLSMALLNVLEKHF